METMYDSTDPAMIPDGKFALLYGTGNYSAREYTGLSRFPHVLWIDDVGDDPLGCSILDIEQGAASIGDVVRWCRERYSKRPGPFRLYVYLSEWASIRRDCQRHFEPEMRAHLHWFVANPTGSPHIVPGSSATQYAWDQGFDVSLALPRFFGTEEVAPAG